MNWISCQIGARENYSIPRALHQERELTYLITDAWVSPQSHWNFLPANILTNFRERYHPDLDTASVHCFNNSLIQFELISKLHKNTGWEKIIARNKWFQKKCINTLKSLTKNSQNPHIIFSYSYAALELFKFAKSRGWYTVLGQIDPGIEEEKIVIQEYEKYPQYRGEWQPAPDYYWQTWQEECKLADTIVVNSNWSRQLLEKAGINSQKIKTIPLVYTPPKETIDFVRTYPESFSQQRPLRILFLGQVILRKGIAAILDSIKLLEGYPVEFWIVGSQQIEIPAHLQTHPQIRWIGHINRSETGQYYQIADIFLFPTLSDGFGLTQLEAKSWKLPIITSRYCGEVVTDGVDGWVLEEVSGKAIAALIKSILEDKNKIKKYSQNYSQNSYSRLELLCISDLFTSLKMAIN